MAPYVLEMGNPQQPKWMRPACEIVRAQTYRGWPAQAQESRSKQLEKVKMDSSIGHWKNWDQLLSAESGGLPPTPASIQGAKNAALYAMRKGGRWVRSEVVISLAFTSVFRAVIPGVGL